MNYKVKNTKVIKTLKHHLDKDINSIYFMPYAVYFNYTQDQQVSLKNKSHTFISAFNL